MMQIVGELYFLIVGSPGGASMEELLPQLPENVTGSGLNKEDPGRAPSLPFAFHQKGGHVTGHQQQGVCKAKVCVVPEAMNFEVSVATKIYIVIFSVRTLCSLWVGISLEAAGSYVNLKCWDYMIPQPTKLQYGGICCL
jgi:hypothetical protein